MENVLTLVDIIVIIFAALTSLVVCLKAGTIGKSLGVMDIPIGRKDHDRPTPLVGGLAVLLPAVVFGVILSFIHDIWWLPVLCFSVWAAFFLGNMDDRTHIKPVYRLLVTTGLLTVTGALVQDLVLTDLRWSLFVVTTDISVWGGAFTVFCLVGFLNALNMADGRNGLVIGMSLVWTILLSLYAPSNLLPVLFTLGASLIVTLFFNLKSKLFLGDAGSYGLSVFFGFMAIYVYNVSPLRPNIEVIGIWFLIPTMDCLRLIVSRIRRGQSPFEGDRTHFHHYLSDVMPWGKGLALYLLMVIIPSVFVYFIPEASGAVLVLSIIGYFSVWAGLKSHREKSQMGHQG